MRTRTIFEAYDRVFVGVDWIIPPKRARQYRTFRAELLRRMDGEAALTAELEARRLVMAERERIANMPRAYSAGG